MICHAISHLLLIKNIFKSYNNKRKEISFIYSVFYNCIINTMKYHQKHNDIYIVGILLLFFFIYNHHTLITLYIIVIIIIITCKIKNIIYLQQDEKSVYLTILRACQSNIYCLAPRIYCIPDSLVFLSI